MSKPFLATAAAAIAMLATPQAHADNWGCEVLLCLSNPAGPMAVSQCVPPIQRLYKAIFKTNPDPFPTCTMSNGQDSSSGGNYAYVAPSLYDGCPTGTTAIAKGNYAAKGRPPTAAEKAKLPKSAPQSFIMTSGTFMGIGDYANPSSSEDSVMPQKVCGGNYLGQTTSVVGQGSDDQQWIRVDVYDRVVLIAPATSSFNINVMMNNQLYRNVRPFSATTMRDV